MGDRERSHRRKLTDDPRLAEAVARKGCLSEDWLDDPTASADPWQIETTVWNPLEHRDAFLGNGWMGQRFTPDGDARYEDTSQAWCYGVREPTAQPGGRIRELPAWARLAVREPILRLRRHCEEVSHYHQALDLRRSCLETSSLRTTPGGVWQEKRTAWIARHEPGLAVLSCQITPRWGEHFVIDDEVDAAHCADLREVTILGDANELLVLDGRFGPHRIALAVRLLCTTPTRLEFEQRPHGWRRRLLPEWIRDQPVTVTKIVGIATSDSSPDPVAAARAIVERAAADLPAARAAHEAAWAALWECRIEVDHPRLQQLINAACHTLYSSVRAGSAMSLPPCGLSGAGWRGQVFWDAETWMLPVLDLLQPELGASLLEYRLTRADQARALAAAAGEPGARIPWQSADDGHEGCTNDEFIAERHVGSSVALALWQHWIITGDRAWLARAWPLLRDLAVWWAARAEQDTDGAWHIRRVGCPDEYAGIRDDNACTNAGAATTLRLATHAASFLGEAADPRWTRIADGLVIPRDPASGVPLEYDGYNGEEIKQADAILLVHPWQWVENPADMRALRDFYRPRYSRFLIMMSESIDGIVSCRLGEADDAWAVLRRLLPYLRRPFLLPSESPWNEAMIFHTGLGGLLQIIVHGFAGLRLGHDGTLSFRPCLPHAIRSITLEGLHHQGRRHRLRVLHNATGCTADLTPL